MFSKDGVVATAVDGPYGPDGLEGHAGLVGPQGSSRVASSPGPPHSDSAAVSSEIVRLTGVRHAFGTGDLRKPVLHGVDLTIHRGEIVILAGPSGSGKTTILTLISGLRTLQEGSIQLFGQELLGASPELLVQLRRRIGFIFQAHNILSFLTARQNVEVSFELHPEIPRNEIRSRTEEVMVELGLGDRLDAYPDKLSGGQKQRVAIARALAARPDLVLADEPTSALDGQSGRTVVTLMEKLARSHGIPILMVTHDHRIFDTADRVVEFEDGMIKSSGAEIPQY